MPWNDLSALPVGTLTPKRESSNGIPWMTFVYVFILIFIFFAITVIVVQMSYLTNIRDTVKNVPSEHVGIVLGAAINPNGTPSDALQDRIETAARLYHEGTVKVLLMSGDGGANKQNEVLVMKQEAIKLGVPEDAIFVDPRGFRTYETCKRAIQTYHIPRAILITQKFHLPRALFLCNELGLSSYGMVADQQIYKKATFFQWREYLASIKAFFDIYAVEPKSPVEEKAG